jgi:hypothetical protein
MRRSLMGARRPVAIGAMALVCALAAASTGLARTVHRSAPTDARRTVVARADGGVTLIGIYTSPNPHCLEARRWKRLSDGYYHDGFQSYLVFPSGGTANPPRLGFLSPVSPFGRSPFVWRASWPGSTVVNVDEHNGKHVKETVADATGVRFYYEIPVSGAPGLPKNGYFTTYRAHGRRIKLRCGAHSSDHHSSLYPIG